MVAALVWEFLMVENRDTDSVSLFIVKYRQMTV